MLDADAARQQAVVTQDHHTLVAQIRHQPFTLVQVQRHAFVTVVSHTPRECDSVLGDRQQPLLLRRHRNTVAGVGVQHRLQIMACAVDGAVDHIAGVVDPQARRVIDKGAVQIDLDQVGGADFVEQQPESIDQEMRLGPWHPRREMRVDMIGPLVQRRQSVGRGQLDPHLPLLRCDPLAHIAQDTGNRRDATHGKSSWMT